MGEAAAILWKEETPLRGKGAMPRTRTPVRDPRKEELCGDGAKAQGGHHEHPPTHTHPRARPFPRAALTFAGGRQQTDPELPR